MSDETLFSFKPVVRLAGLTAKGDVVALDPAYPRQLTDACDKLARYSVRPFGDQFQVIADIRRSPWTVVVPADPTTQYERQVMPVFLDPCK